MERDAVGQQQMLVFSARLDIFISTSKIILAYFIHFSLKKKKKKKLLFFPETLDFIKCLKLEKRLDMLCLHENYFILIYLVDNVSVLHESSTKK